MAEDTKKSAWSTEVVSGTVMKGGVFIWLVKDTFPPMCPAKGAFGVRGEAGKLKVVLLIRGCVCRGRPFDTSAALFEEGGGGIRCCCCCLLVVTRAVWEM